MIMENNWQCSKFVAGSYYYVEGRGGNNMNELHQPEKYADLETAVLEPLEFGGRTLTFYWNMYGAAVNKLEVLVRRTGTDYISSNWRL